MKIKRYISYWKSVITLKRQQKLYQKQALLSAVAFPVTKTKAVFADKADDAGFLPHHYFFQDLYVAQRIYQNNPAKHIDIGSRIDGFVAHVAAFRKIEIHDIRPMNKAIPNVQFTQCDLMNLKDEQMECTDSISCLHALEHFGLGRYGDDICYDGYLLGFMNIYKMLKKNGKFYFSVPLGKQRTEFHAHRVFSLRYLVKMVTPYYEIDRFSYIDQRNTLHENVNISDGIDHNFGCHYGCAILELTKK